jgi:hypothetical protein
LIARLDEHKGSYRLIDHAPEGQTASVQQQLQPFIAARPRVSKTSVLLLEAGVAEKRATRWSG